MCWDTEVFVTEVSIYHLSIRTQCSRKLFDSEWKEKEIIQGMCAEFHRDWKYPAVFSTKCQFLERVLVEHIDAINSLDSELKVYSICYIVIRFRY